MNYTSKLSQSYHRSEIDGIRAFAVIAIIINHFNKDFLPSGYLGVDIFFVVSGFVITSSTARRSSKDLRDFILEFYSRRIKRLIPALFVFVFITSILICLFDPTPDFSILTGITSLFGISNFYLLQQSTNYFADSTELNVFVHTWSLGVEEQFYFLFPFLTWVTGFSRLENKGLRNLFWIMGILSLISFILFFYTLGVSKSAAYFLMPNRFWELGSGCLLYLSLKRPNSCFHVFERTPPLLVVVAITTILALPLDFQFQTTVLVVFFTSILITCLKERSNAYKIFTHPKVVYIGLISYSLYLWHWSVLSLSRWTIGIHWWSVPVQIVAMLLLAIFSYHYVEAPLRYSDWSDVRWKSITYGIVSSCFLAILLLFLIKIPNFSLYAGRRSSIIARSITSLTDTYALKQVDSVWQGEECVISDDSDVGKKILIKNCTLGDFSAAKKRVMVFGNSFSAAFTEAFDDLVVSDGYAVTITSSWAAPPIIPLSTDQVSKKSNFHEANNYYWEVVVPSLINQLRYGDWVFLINDMAEFSPKHRTSETDANLKRLKDSLEVLSNKLSARGIRLAILHGNPFAREAYCRPAMAIKQWFRPFDNTCKLPSRSESLLRRDKLDKLLTSLDKENKLRVIDIFDIFCFEEQCTYFAKNGQLLYRDAYSHPSVDAVRLSSSIIRKILTSQ